jgi:hypothetical protein
LSFGTFRCLKSTPTRKALPRALNTRGAHGRFWEMHDGIYENQDRLGLPLLFALAGALGLSETGLRNALVGGEYEPKVRSDFLGGVRSGVNGSRHSSSMDGGMMDHMNSMISPPPSEWLFKVPR